jgi:hypothetical protein
MNWYTLIKSAAPIGPNMQGLGYLAIGHDFDVGIENHLWFLTLDGDFISKLSTGPYDVHAGWDKWVRNDNLGTIVSEGRVECVKGQNGCKASLVLRQTLTPHYKEFARKKSSKMLDEKFNNPEILVMR